MNHVLVMADRGEPLVRLAVGRNGSVVNIVHPGRVADYEAGRVAYIGFPAASVFQYDEGLYTALRQSWDAGRMADASLWKKAVPFREDDQ